MKKALIDTDTLSFFFRGNKNVVAKLDKYLREYGYVNISVITYYEVLNGLLYKDAKKQLSKFLQFARLNRIIPLTVPTADKAAEIIAELRKNGNAISHNDVLIASIAITNDLVLITNNTAHFLRIKELEIDNWTIE